MNATNDFELLGLIRGLATDFPLHTHGELERALRDAEDDLWPHKDPIDVLDRARQRLSDGLLN